MSIDENGLITWTPIELGNFPVELKAKNDCGEDTQEWIITVKKQFMVYGELGLPNELECNYRPEGGNCVQGLYECDGEPIEHIRLREVTSPEAPEGDRYLEVTIIRGCDYEGTFHLHGDPLDMSEYQEGCLRFFIKSLIELKIGIRSQNIYPGDEASIVNLSEYTQLDDNWHEVGIPIHDFKEKDLNLDLSKMVILFNVLRVGQIEEEEEMFDYDYVRWEQRKCPSEE